MMVAQGGRLAYLAAVSSRERVHALSRGQLGRRTSSEARTSSRSAPIEFLGRR